MLRSPEGFLHCLYAKRRNVITIDDFGCVLWGNYREKVRKASVEEAIVGTRGGMSCGFWRECFLSDSRPGLKCTKGDIPLPGQTRKGMNPWTCGLGSAIPSMGLGRRCW